MNPASRHPTFPRGAQVLIAVSIAALSTTGCATPDAVRYGDVVAVPSAYTPAQRPLSIGEIVAALRSGRSQHDLAEEIDERGLLAPATSADIDLLLQSGADAELIDAVRDASSSPPSTAGVAPSPPVIVSPPVVVTPPAPFYPDYGWYPYAPYVPYSFGFWYSDPPRHRFHRDDRDRFRHDRDRRSPAAVAPNWQSPRAPGGSSPSQGLIDRQGRRRIPLDEGTGRSWSTPNEMPGVRPTPQQPRGSMGAPNTGGGAVRNRRSIPD